MDKKKDKKNIQSFKETEIKRLKEGLESTRKQYLRALADYHNLEKRIQDTKEETIKHATKRVILRLLPFLDNLEKAEIFIKDPGLGMIKNQFYKTLQEEGVEELTILGKHFNPEQAEAVDTVDGKEDDIIAEVVRKGYALFGKVIRPAQVKVMKLKS